MERKVKSFDGTRINYDIVRKKNKKRFLIFLGGAGGDLTSWRKEREFLHKNLFSTIAIDYRGHGLSDRPENPSDYKLENFARDLYEVIKQEKIRNPIIIGYCFGGMVAINFHRLYPKIARAYCFIDTTYKSPGILKRIFNRKINRIVRLMKYPPEFNHNHYNRFVNTGDWNILRILSNISHTSLKSWLFTYENISNFNGISVLRSIEQPVLILEGEKDSIFRVVIAKKIEHLLKNSKLNIISNANHIIVINNPKEVEEQLLRFANKIFS